MRSTVIFSGVSDLLFYFFCLFCALKLFCGHAYCRHAPVIVASLVGNDLVRINPYAHRRPQCSGPGTSTQQVGTVELREES